MKKIYILTAVLALLTLSLNAQVLASKYGTEPPLKSPTVKVKAPNRADVLIPGCSWDVTNDGTTLPSGWEKTANLRTNSDGSAYLNSSSGGTITIPSSILQGNSTVKVVINAASYDGSTYTISVNNNTKNVYDTNFSDYTWMNVNAANGITITMNSWNVSLMSIKVYSNNEPDITATPNNITFKCVPGETPTPQTVEVTGSNLTDDIIATLNDPNNVFSINTTNLGTSGGNLTITYSPTAVGAHTGTITLTSGSTTATITLNGSCVNEMTVCDGSTTTGDLPIYGLWYDATNGQHNQMIYLASELSTLVGKDITSMTFYAPSGLKFYDGSVTFSIGTTNASSFSSATALTDNVTPVATVVPQQGETEWIITFSEPYPYTGGNLLIQVDSQTGEFGTTNFSGKDVGSNRGFLSYNTTNSMKSTLPKVTFGYVDNTTPKIEVSPNTLTISDSGTNNTFTVQGSNLGTDNVGVTVPQGSAFSTTTSDQYWGFVNNNGSVNGTATVTYGGRALSATETVTAANNLTSATVDVTYVPDLYIVGNFGSDWNYSADATIPMTNNNGIYTATLNDIPANSYILFSRKIGETYYWDNNRLFIGAVMDNGQDWEYGINEQPGSLDTDPSYPSKYRPIHFSEGGTYIVTIDANAYTFTITKSVPDLAIALSAPASIVGGNSATVTATVTNNGDLPATSYTVTITADGNTILTQTVNTELAVGASATFSADYATTAAQVGSTVSFAANVTCTDDANATNDNATASMDIISVPAPENVVATTNEDQTSATVTWDAPSNSSAFPLGPTTLIWDFEEESDFTEFTAIDSDGDGYNWNWYTNVGASSTLVTHEGDGVVYSQSYDKPTTTVLYPDNWLISPEITLGGSLSFWACGQDANQYWNEVFAVYVCVGSYNSVDDFIKISPDVTTTHDMTKYTYDLSQYQGQGYFAIRHYNVHDEFYLNVDDITCETFAPAPPISYNIYLDGVLVGSVDANDPLSYDFGTLAAGTHTASVSAVYYGGVESAATPSNEFTIVAKTPTPTITHTETPAGVVITATGEGHVTLVVDGITYEGEGSVSATVVRSPEEREVTATATAQASGALPSDKAEEDITIPALTTDPTEMAEGLLRLHLLMVDQMFEDIPDDNSHPDRYNYVLRYEPNGPTGSGVKESSTVHVDIQKADCEVTGYYSLKQIDGDTIIGLDHKQGITMDVVTADVAYNLSNNNDMLYEYLLQGATTRVPEYQEDFLTKLRKSQNFTYFEMWEKSPNKGQEYPNGEHHYLDSLMIGNYGSTFRSYAPSVSTDGIQRRYYEDDGFDNTYGAPIWKTAVGEVKMSEEEAPIAERQTNQWNSVNWTDKDAQGNDAPASLFILDNIWATAKLPHTQIATVKYEPYMFRVFVQSNNGLLRPYKVVPQGEGQYDGEHLDAVDRDLTEADVKGPKCVWSGYLQFDEDGEVIGDLPNGVEVQPGTDDGGQKTFTYHKSKVDRQGGSNATLPQPSEWDKDPNNAMFGALDALAISGYDAQGKPILRNDITEDDLKIFVRFYYVVKGMADGWTPGTRGQGDDPAGYGSESGSSSPGIATSVNEIRYHGEAVETIYYNVQGMSSDRPFEGVNIVVTRYSDGATVVSKVIR